MARADYRVGVEESGAAIVKSFSGLRTRARHDEDERRSPGILRVRVHCHCLNHVKFVGDNRKALSSLHTEPFAHDNASSFV